MSKTIFESGVERGIRIFLGLVFLIAGTLKITDPEAFADSIATFRILPSHWINVVALGCPPLEIILGGALVLGWRVRSAVFSIMLLMFVFTIALGQALSRGLSVNCGCFGSYSLWGNHPGIDLSRDIVLLVFTTLLYARICARTTAE